jgi:hypothetical protein
MRNTTAFLSLFLLALFLLPTASQAMPTVATASCQDGAAVTVAGKILGFIPAKTGFWMDIEAPTWDCKRVFMFVKNKGTCHPESDIQASGTLSKHEKHDPLKGWVLSEATTAAGAASSSSFSCKDSTKKRP